MSIFAEIFFSLDLQIGQVLCLSGGGGPPPSGGCGQTYTVVSGDTCADIESRTGVSDSQLHVLNPSINSGCTNLQIGQVLCVGGGGGSPPGGGQSFNGLATFYDPDGGFGACGSPLQNGDFIVALGTGHWDGGSHCGQTVNVQFQGRTIQVSVQDLCPGCQGANGIDLSEGAMAALDSNYLKDGVISVVWSFA
ncbi:RlpA-like double-psi beta-barrel-protein domain-containing protein-containing protein [Mycena sp. CBHHK59/15]|nr:RlpA-like double-psi beta-barrel-protein domain-containing protein-containing protein [Mycena sp. CBHHK59/15]